jgi:hypothetical protein
VQPGLVSEEVEVAPATPHAVVNALPVRSASRTRQLFRIARHFEIDPALAGVEFDLGDHPRRFETQGGSKQGFDTNTHCAFLISHIEIAVRRVTVAGS